ncbi:MAG: hypothetical protein JWO62_2464 [Acidimicrobiaceae bacterium]|nr:hypothetical protein [Acidimicrobiaceae bacterium]
MIERGSADAIGGPPESSATRSAGVRILTLMGSGETSPTMVKVHRSVLERLGPPPVPAVLLATPFGFQENARELAARAVTYFRESLQTTIDVAALGTEQAEATSPSPDAGPFEDERLTATLRDARYVFAGPGSPTYALRRWRGGVVPGLLAEKLTRGGAVTFASAAALTLGAFTVPVYEIYKAGDDPSWLDGLDVLGAVGLHVAVIPHYNNAEGGTHDTRFCYLGERRLAVMEAMLPDDHFVLGVDEHTACVVDLEARSVSVGGIGVMTVRRHGRSVIFASGEQISLDELLAAALHEPADGAAAPAGPNALGAHDTSPETRNSSAAVSTSPLLDIVRDQETAFAASVAAHDTDAAVAAVLDLERQVVDWSTDIPQQDELDRAHASLRAMVVEIGSLATDGVRDPRDVVGPYVEMLVEMRRLAREARRFDEADLVRDRLASLGVELRDEPDGTSWLLTSTP